MRTSNRSGCNIYSLAVSLLISASLPTVSFADEADEQTEEMTVMGAMKTPVVAEAEVEQYTMETIEEIPVTEE